MPKDILGQIKKATVAIAHMNAQDPSGVPFTIVGTGFCVDPEGLVVTCRHVMDSMMKQPIEKQLERIPLEEREKKRTTLIDIMTRKFYAVFYNTTDSHVEMSAYPCMIVGMVAKLDFDLALVKIKSHVTFKEGFPFVDIENFEDVNEGDEILTCGFPLGNYLYEQLGTATSSFTRGIVSSIIPSPNVKPPHLLGFQLNLTATNGNSGGPVFLNETGKVFGVLQGGVVHNSGAIIQGLVKAEPIYPVVDERLFYGLKNPPIS